MLSQMIAREPEWMRFYERARALGAFGDTVSTAASAAEIRRRPAQSIRTVGARDVRRTETSGI
jgi:hypothetical protein